MTFIEVSDGEIIDKLSIIEVKLNKIQDQEKIKYILREYQYLKEVVVGKIDFDIGDPLYTRLHKINYELWEIEDKIRSKEEQSVFDEEFVELSRSIYILNDERARIKKEINTQTKSRFVEQKSHKTVY